MSTRKLEPGLRQLHPALGNDRVLSSPALVSSQSPKAPARSKTDTAAPRAGDHFEFSSNAGRAVPWASNQRRNLRLHTATGGHGHLVRGTRQPGSAHLLVPQVMNVKVFEKLRLAELLCTYTCILSKSGFARSTG